MTAEWLAANGDEVVEGPGVVAAGVRETDAFDLLRYFLDAEQVLRASAVLSRKFLVRCHSPWRFFCPADAEDGLRNLAIPLSSNIADRTVDP